MSFSLEPGAISGLIAIVAFGIAAMLLFRRHLMPAYRIGTRELRAHARYVFRRGIPTTDEIVNAAAIEWGQQRVAIFGYLAFVSMTGTMVEVVTNQPGSPIFSILLTIWFMSITARVESKRRSFRECARLDAQNVQSRSRDIFGL